MGGMPPPNNPLGASDDFPPYITTFVIVVAVFFGILRNLDLVKNYIYGPPTHQPLSDEMGKIS